MGATRRGPSRTGRDYSAAVACGARFSAAVTIGMTSLASSRMDSDSHASFTPVQSAPITSSAPKGPHCSRSAINFWATVLGEPKMTRSSMMPLTVMSLSAMSGWALRACSLPRFLKMVRM